MSLPTMNYVTIALLGLLAPVASAGVADQLLIAASRVAEQPNYTWQATVVDDLRTYEITGRTEIGGLTWMRLPMVRSVARRLGREAGVQIEAVFCPAGRAVLHTERGWKALEELPRKHRDWRERPVSYYDRPPLVAWQPAFLGLESESTACETMLQVSSEPYSHGQFSAIRPHEDLALIVSEATELKSEGQIVTGTLGEMVARLLLVREGDETLTPLAALGRFALELRGGTITRYTVWLDGVLATDDIPVRVRQQITTVISQPGRSEVAVPEEARLKLGSRYAVAAR